MLTPSDSHPSFGIPTTCHWRRKNCTDPLKNLHMFFWICFMVQKYSILCHRSHRSHRSHSFTNHILGLVYLYLISLPGHFFFFKKKAIFLGPIPGAKVCLLSACTHPRAGGVITEGGQEVHHADHLLSRATATRVPPGSHGPFIDR